MAGFYQDLRLALRSLFASRTTTVAAILVLALGTGINTGVLAVAYGILVRPLPYPDPSRIVVIDLRAAEGPSFGVPGAEFEEWQRRLRTVRYLGAYSVGEFTLRGVGEPRVVRVALLRGDFFQVMGAPAVLGRVGSALDGWVVVGARVAEQLTGSRSPIGESVTVGRTSYVVSAVMAGSFAFPSEEIGAWLPSSPQTAIGLGDRPDARTFRLVARLRPGVTIPQVSEDATRVLRELRPAKDSRDRNAARFQARAVVTELDEVLTGSVRPVLGALVAAAILVLLVACGNVASLLVGRAAVRNHEVAVRLALGASRWHLVRGVLAESLVLAVAASAIGVWIGYALVRLFVGVAAGVFPRTDVVAVDLPVLLASVVMAFAVALVCGAAPALNAARSGFAPVFRAAATSSRPARRLRAVLAAGQIALSIVLLAGAGLVARTVMRLLDQSNGIEPRGVVSLRLVMSDSTTFTATSRIAFVRQVAERVRSLPGVQSAGIGSGLPPRVSPLSMGVRVVSPGRDEFQVLTLVSVTPGYLQALGARLLRGRMLREADFEGGPVALLSESAARHLSPRQDPIGRPLVFPLPGAAAGRNRRPQVVGIIGDIKYGGLDSTSAGAIYVLWPDLPAGVGHLVVRGAGEPAAFAASLRRAVREFDTTLPVPDVRTLDDEILSSIADRRLRLIPASSLALLALGVALVGLSASMTRAVAERRRELAIRGALGASPEKTVRMILGEGARVTAAGIGAGLVLAAALGRTLAKLLYGVSPHDPATFGAVATVVAATALAVCYLAARRALRLDLVELLRAE